MKKSLLVLAVAAAVPVLAQAQTNVTLYGRVDAAVGFEKNATGNAMSLLSGVQSSNRWGVRGAEDLGGGLKAVFNLEGGFDADVGRGLGGTGNLPSGSTAGGSFVPTGGLDFRRRSVVGLEGGFGSLVFGRDYDPLFRVLLGSDNLGLGHYANVHTNFGTSYGVRIDNGIHYVSPSLGGFVVRGAYGLSEAFAGVKSAGRAVSLAAEYAAGPLYVGVGYRANNIAALAVDGSSGIVGSANKYTALGARYNFGAFAVNGGYGVRNPGGALNNTKTLWVGGDVQAGPGRLHVQFSTIDPDGAGKASALGVTYNYPLSKRTNAYATFGTVRNNAATAYSLSTSSTALAAGAPNGDPRGLAFGVGHNF
jgi:predicted porin